jgi:hypothetical protein
MFFKDHADLDVAVFPEYAVTSALAAKNRTYSLAVSQFVPEEGTNPCDGGLQDPENFVTYI